jgi:hypothetical protein
MRWILAFLLGAAAYAQTPAMPPHLHWRQSFTGILGRPPGSLTARDLAQLETELALAAQYCTSLTPVEYAANQQLVRQMTTYLATVQVPANDPQMNLSMRRLTRSLAAFPCAYAVPVGQGAQAIAAPAPTPPTPGEAPFVKTAPVIDDLPAADQERVADLRTRYEADAGRAATAWKNAEEIRRNLAAKGMSLNAQTAAAVDRLKLLLDEAADELRTRKWDDALASLQGVEATIDKVNKTAGN